MSCLIFGHIGVPTRIPDSLIFDSTSATPTNSAGHPQPAQALSEALAPQTTVVTSLSSIPTQNASSTDPIDDNGRRSADSFGDQEIISITVGLCIGVPALILAFLAWWYPKRRARLRDQNEHPEQGEPDEVDVGQ